MANRSDGPEIRDVWSANLEAEMENIRVLIDNYPFVALVRRISIAWRLASIISIGHRVSGCGREAYRGFQDIV